MTEAESLRARTEFVVELSRRLHAYGTASQRLEAAVGKVAKRLGLTCEIWANPTGILISFGGALGDAGGPENTRVLRMAPGDIDLAKMCATDAIAESVITGAMDARDGRTALRALDKPTTTKQAALAVLCFGLTSGSVAVLLKSGWPEVITAALIGWLVGLIYQASASSSRLSEALDALAAFTATFIAFAVTHYITPLALDSVVIASIIVLLPGLSLTIAVSELSSQQLVAGTSRFAGAIATLLKLTFGAVAALQIGRALGWHTAESVSPPLPEPFVWLALLVAAYAFAVLFRARLRDYPLVMGAAILSFVVTRYSGATFGTEAGVFFSGVAIAAAGNLYARLFNRPGALIRVPGIILLVPGSTGFRSLSFVFERDVYLGLDAGVTVITVLITLVAGLMIGNLLIAPRRNL